MRLPVTTLQPDIGDRLNISHQFIHGMEPVMQPLTGGKTTNNKTYVQGNRPVVAREKVVLPDDSAKNSYREGPIVIPYLRHLLGQNQGAFCADNFIMPVIGDAKDYVIGTVVGVYDCGTTLYLPYVKLIRDFAAATPPLLVGVIRGVIEDEAKRAYTGATAEDITLYVFQFCGLARALVREGETVAPGAPLYLEAKTEAIPEPWGLTSKEIGNLTALNMGASLDTEKTGYKCNIVFILLGNIFSPKGDKVLYGGVFLREYDADGVIVAPGSEVNPYEYSTQEEYEAALAAINHSLKPTWDFGRVHG